MRPVLREEFRERNPGTFVRLKIVEVFDPEHGRTNHGVQREHGQADYPNPAALHQITRRA
jgi:hypothetical protein